MNHARARLASSLVVLIAACMGDDTQRHVFSSPPPRPRIAAVPASTVAPTGLVPGASVTIDGVRVASTGVPASLGEITEPVELMVLMRRGASTGRGVPLRLELRLDGATDTTLVTPLAPPVPAIAAQRFRLPVAPEAPALAAGRYTVQARLLAPGGRLLASSIPLALVVLSGR